MEICGPKTCLLEETFLLALPPAPWTLHYRVGVTWLTRSGSDKGKGSTTRDGTTQQNRGQTPLQAVSIPRILLLFQNALVWLHSEEKHVQTSDIIQITSNQNKMVPSSFFFRLGDKKLNRPDLSLRPCRSPHPPFSKEEEERKVNAGFILGLEPGCAREHPVHCLAFYSSIACFTVKPGVQSAATLLVAAPGCWMKAGTRALESIYRETAALSKTVMNETDVEVIEHVCSDGEISFGLLLEELGRLFRVVQLQGFPQHQSNCVIMPRSSEAPRCLLDGWS
ncbi:hypothetical protein Q8A73_007061 [Channa argus]|nr:hypothetical protein Q8A73_007061 [Channa argus]